jgi:hypothetical protein
LSFELPTIVDHKGNVTDAAPGSGHVVRIPIPANLNPDKVNEFSLLVRYLPSRQNQTVWNRP